VLITKIFGLEKLDFSILGCKKRHLEKIGRVVGPKIEISSLSE